MAIVFVILFWLFKTIKETSALDNIVRCRKFLNYAIHTRDRHRMKARMMLKIGNAIVHGVSQHDERLYEVFAELVDVLNEKLAVQSK